MPETTAAETISPEALGTETHDEAESDEETDEETEVLRERYQELIDELRVLLPGVQVLFAFLLTAPFSGRFADLDSTQLSAYFAALVTSTLGLISLLTPIAYHRISNRSDRRSRIDVAVRSKLAGLVFLWLSITTGLFAVTSFAFDNTRAIGLSILAGSAALVLWVIIPLLDRD